MRIRKHTLWRVPVYCMVSGWISFYLTAYIGGFFFTNKTIIDGTTHLSVDPIRSLIFHGVLFAAILLLGGLFFFRNMTKQELALSAAIASALYLIITLGQIFVPELLRPITMSLAKIQNWDAFVSSLLMQVTSKVNLSALLSNLTPFLFVLFGKKKAHAS